MSDEPILKVIFWIDMEMTGLDEKVDSILEVAAVVTDLNLKPLEEYGQVVFQSQEVLDGMNNWCKEQHGNSRLSQEVKEGKPLGQVERDLLAMIDRHYQPNEEAVIAGNSIGNDRRFIDKYLPKIAKRLHYRMIDVSSFKEIFRSKYGVKVEKKDTHRALTDIHESIEELKSYLAYIKVP